MGREIRRVPADWQHPRYGSAEGIYAECDERLDRNPHLFGRHIALLDGSYRQSYAEWLEEKAQWQKGFRLDWGKSDGDNRVWKPIEDEYRDQTFEEWGGEAPEPQNYMPDWDESELTHIMMYETCSEGTPISPAFETPEELARWLADNGASAFGSMTATYEQWLATCRAGWAPSAIASPETGLMSGVEASGRLEDS